MAARVRIDTTVAGGGFAFGSITGAYQNGLTSVQGRGVILYILNSLNTDSVISLDGGTTDFVVLPAGVSISLDLATNDAEYFGSVSVKHNGVAPASGRISFAIVRIK